MTCGTPPSRKCRASSSHPCKARVRCGTGFGNSRARYRTISANACNVSRSCAAFSKSIFPDASSISLRNASKISGSPLRKNRQASSNRSRYASSEIFPMHGAEQQAMRSLWQCLCVSASGFVASHLRMPQRRSAKSRAVRTTADDGNGPKYSSPSSRTMRHSENRGHAKCDSARKTKYRLSSRSEMLKRGR